MYYKVKQGVLEQNLSKLYHFESANTVCDQFNRLICTLKKEEEKEKDNDKYHKGQKSMCQTFKKQIGGNSKIETSYNS